MEGESGCRPLVVEWPTDEWFRDRLVKIAETEVNVSGGSEVVPSCVVTDVYIAGGSVSFRNAIVVGRFVVVGGAVYGKVVLGPGVELVCRAGTVNDVYRAATWRDAYMQAAVWGILG